MVNDTLISIGHHRAPSIPAFPTNNVNGVGEECIRRAHNRADIEIVLPVLDRYMKRVTAGVEIPDNGLNGPVPVVIHDVARITFLEQFRIKMIVSGPFALPRPDTPGRCLRMRILIVHTPSLSTLSIPCPLCPTPRGILKDPPAYSQETIWSS